MQIKYIIVEIIKQDLRFNQYIINLRKLGIEMYDFEIDLMSIVARLMEKDPDELPDSWGELYVEYLSKSGNYEIEPLGNNLNMLAEEFYLALLELDSKKNGIE